MRSNPFSALALIAIVAVAGVAASCSGTGPRDGPTGVARAAILQPTVITDILGDPAGSTAWVYGRAEPLAEVLIYAQADCHGDPIQSTVADVSGRFEVSFAPPSSDTAISALDSQRSMPCSSSLPYNTIHHECPALPADRPVSRPPIPTSVTAGYFDSWEPQIPGWQDFYAELVADPPVLQYHYDFAGTLPFNTGMKGVPTGAPNPYWGDPSFTGTITAPLLSPSELAIRLGYLSDYLAEYEGLTLTGQYADFGNAIYGNHWLRTGFWEFYDAWSGYDAAFDLGGAPPASPEEWLKHHWDPNYLRPQDPDPLPDQMKGLSFTYGPEQPLYGGQYRYSANILSDGWARYWGEVVRHTAQIGYEISYFDNAMFSMCWNDTCEDVYDGWLANRFTQAEIDRWFSYTTSRFIEGTFDINWQYNAGAGTWSNPWLFAASGATLTPDIDAVRGLYSGLVRGPGQLELLFVQVAETPRDVDWHYNAHYKTTCQNAKMRVRVVDGGTFLADYEEPLPPTSSWSQQHVAFWAPSSAGVGGNGLKARLSFETNGSCLLWVDDASLHAYGEAPVVETRLARSKPFDHAELDSPFMTPGAEMSMKFWDSAVDDQLAYLRAIGKAENPDYDIFVNIGKQRRGAGYFMVEQLALESESALSDVGSPPGVYLLDCALPACDQWNCEENEARPPNGCRCLNYKNIVSPVVVTNEFDFKLVHERRFVDEFAYNIHYPERKAPWYPYTTDAALLQLAEGAAFGGGAGLDLLLNVTTGYPFGSPLRQSLVSLRHELFEWTNQHPEFYRCLEPSAPLGIVFHDVSGHEPERKIVSLGKDLFAVGLPYDILSEAHVDVASLQRYRAVFYRDIERIPEAEALALISYMQGGGMVILSGNGNGLYNGWWQRWAAHSQPAWPPVTLSPGTKVYPVGSGSLVWFENGATAADIQKALSGLSVTPSLSGAAAQRFRTAIWKGPTRTVVHLVNYDLDLGFQGACDTGSPNATTLTNVTLDIPGPTPGSGSATVYSPETGSFQGTVPVTAGPNGTLHLVVPDVHIYSVVVLE